MSLSSETQINIRDLLREGFRDFYSQRKHRKHMRVSDSLKLLVKKAAGQGVTKGEIARITGMPRSTLYSIIEGGKCLPLAKDLEMRPTEIPVRRLEVIQSRPQTQVTIWLPSGIVIELDAGTFVDGKILSALVGGDDATSR